jgi:DNA primase
MNDNSIVKQIAQQIKIKDLAEEFGIQLEEAAGKFDFRCRCPHHSRGVERTPSLYINTEQNTFFCFGCSKGYNSIDFYMLINEVDFSGAIYKLKDRVNSFAPVSTQKKENNLKYLLSLSSLFRKSLQEHPDDKEWIMSLIKKTDSHLDELKQDDVKSTKKIIAKVKKLLNQKYGEA